MSKKNKNANQRLKKQQQKQKRRDARVQKRGPAVAVHNSGQSEPMATSMTTMPASDVLLDLREIINWQGKREMTEEALHKLIEMGIDSSYLIEEPEFDEIEVSPVDAIGTYIQTAEASGFTPEDNLEEMLEQEREAEQDDGPANTFYRTLFHKLLTPTLKAEIIAALKELRTRLRQEEEQEALLNASAAQFFLETDKEMEIAIEMGIVFAVLFRSIQMGFMTFSSVTKTELEGLDDEKSLADMRKQVKKSLSGKKSSKALQEHLESSPGLARLMNAKVAKMEADGMKALFSSTLNLALFTDEELDHAQSLIEAHATSKLSEVMPDKFYPTVDWASTAPKITDYLTDLFTPARIKQLQKRFRAILNDSTYSKHELAPYLLTIATDIEEIDTKRNAPLTSEEIMEQRFLVPALMGEIFERSVERKKA